MKKLSTSNILNSIVIICCLFAAVILLSIPNGIKHDYRRCADVDKSEKIPIVLSNLVNCVESKNFIVTRICVKPNFFSGFHIEVEGNDYGTIINMD